MLLELRTFNTLIEELRSKNLTSRKPSLWAGLNAYRLASNDASAGRTHTGDGVLGGHSDERAFSAKLTASAPH